MANTQWSKRSILWTSSAKFTPNGWSLTSNYSASLSEEYLVGDASGGGFTITLPSPVGAEGKRYTIKRVDSKIANILSVGTSAGFIGFWKSVKLTEPGQILSLISNGANWLVISEPFLVLLNGELVTFNDSLVALVL